MLRARIQPVRLLGRRLGRFRRRHSRQIRPQSCRFSSGWLRDPRGLPENDGMHGQSFSIYDASRKVWHQSWVTNRGVLLIIEGTWKDGQMTLEGADHPQPGVERRVRGIWKPQGNGVRETAVTSTDGGKTWKPWFDILFL